jgi:hypothetical protein
VKVHRCAEHPESNFTPELEQGLISSVSLRVLSTMKFGLFRLKVIKALVAGKNRRNRDAAYLWLRMRDDTLAPLQNDDQELAWWGIENGSHIVVYIAHQN